MVEQASVAISLTDASARIIYANPAFCRQTGYSLAQLLKPEPAPAGRQPDAARDLSGDVAYPAPASALARPAD
ncbi:PAS domain S-box protein [Klebsiella variicola subsp. variicola]|nr:PAS domain S-box protein [Klebsiella variicola subsp. variicola]